MAHLVQHPVVTVPNQVSVENLQAGHEHRSTLPTCTGNSQQLVFRSGLLLNVEVERNIVVIDSLVLHYFFSSFSNAIQVGVHHCLLQERVLVHKNHFKPFQTSINAPSINRNIDGAKGLLDSVP